MPGRSASLRQIEVELVALGVDEAVGRRRLLRPVTAGVGHLRVEQEGVEVVGEVVVVGDRGAVAAAGVQPPVEAGFRRRRPRPVAPPRRAAGPARAAASTSVRDRNRGRRVGLRQRPEPGEPLGDVAVDLELTRHERPREPQLAGAPQQAPQRPPVPDHDDGAGGGARLGPVPRPDPDGQGRAEEALDEPGELRGDAACSSGAPGRTGRRRGSRRGSPPRSRRGRTPTSGGTCCRTRARPRPPSGAGSSRRQCASVRA